ncbi:LacI family DNA-binding transcriptional regulator [Knoellia sp. CPCC 206435]|uniref:LacI family DNA-binding transcriptional regulator n=1 Tax=Knoellia terrae TaxID=3404797 RepID=UPI003B43B250
MGKPPTIYDVAEAAGVAPSTVSRAFSRPGRLRAETVARVQVAAVAIGYRSAPSRRSEIRVRPRMIGLLVPDITNPFYFEIIRGAETAASDAGFTLVLAHTQESQRLEREALDRTLPVVDGMLLTSSRLPDAAIVTASAEKPLVALNRLVTGVPSVVTDNAAGARRAMEHLAQHGHRSVAYVAGPEASWVDGVRWAATRAAGEDLGMEVRPLGAYPPTMEGGIYAAQTLLEQPVTGVVCYNDQLAIGLMRGLDRLHVHVPTDMSVVGFDNTLIADLVTPGLTTVTAPLATLGAAAVQSLLASLDGGADRTTGPVALPTRLVVRGSTGQARRRRRAARPAPSTDGAATRLLSTS